jgi:hypothetical protein
MNFRNVPVILAPFIFCGIGLLLYYAYVVLQTLILVGIFVYFIRKVWFKIFN